MIHVETHLFIFCAIYVPWKCDWQVTSPDWISLQTYGPYYNVPFLNCHWCIQHKESLFPVSDPGNNEGFKVLHFRVQINVLHTYCPVNCKFKSRTCIHIWNCEMNMKYAIIYVYLVIFLCIILWKWSGVQLQWWSILF